MSSGSVSSDDQDIQDELYFYPLVSRQAGGSQSSTSSAAMMTPGTDNNINNAKGKHAEGTVNAGATTDGVEIDTKLSIQVLREELKRLEALDELTLLVQSDPTEIPQLETSTKIMKSLQILQSSFQQRLDQPSARSESNNLDDPISPFWNSLSLESYSMVLELLSSALSDVASGQPSNSNTSSSLYDLAAARAKLQLSGINLPPRRNTPPHTAQTFATASALPAESTSNEVAKLFSENTRLMIIQLNPAFLRESRPVEAPVSVIADASIPSFDRPSPINTIPPEILAHIFSFARTLGEVREAGDDERTGTLRARSRGCRVIEAPSSTAVSPEYHGSRAAAQRWIHQIALVCKKWAEVSRSNAYHHLHLRGKRQLRTLLSLAEAEGTAFAQHVIEINTKITLPTSDIDELQTRRGNQTSAGAYFGGGAIFVGTGWGPLSTSAKARNGSTEASGSEEEVVATHGELFSNLVKLTPNLAKLSLTISTNGYSIPFGNRQGATDFLEPIILSTLSSIPNLRTLRLGTSLDFEELEVILLGLPSLVELRLDGGFDSIDGRGAISSSEAHQCKLEILTVGDGNHLRDFTQVTDVQLAWLLEPTVASMRHLEITVMSMNVNNGIAGGWGAALGQAVPPAFASALFADQISRMGNTLERLAFRDLQHGNAVSQSLMNAPHNGTFDDALSHCTRLKELSIPFHLTGANFLDSLQSSPHIESLIFLGTPTIFTAADLADRIESQIQFRDLIRIVVQGQFVGRAVNGGGGGWLSGDVRRLKKIAAERKVQCIFSSQ